MSHYHEHGSNLESWIFEDEIGVPHGDDGFGEGHLMNQLSQLIDSITRVGGEVCRLRAEVDGILEHNASLEIKLKRLHALIEEKGTVNLEDFELACEIVSSEESSVERGQNKNNRH